MSFLDSKQTGTMTATSTIDPDLKQAYLNQINFANTVAARPFQQYEGPQVAGFSGDQQNAFQGIRNLQGQYQPYIDGAANTIRSVMNQTPGQVSYAGPQAQGYGIERSQAGSFLGGNIAQYMNPYTDQVINQSLADNERARQFQQQSINAQALSRGAFGGSRQAIAETENNRNFLDQQARTSAQLRNQGFDTAANLMTADMNRATQNSQFNATNQNAANSFLAGTQNQFALNNANQQMAAQQANVDNMLRGNAQRISAANQFANLGSLGQQLGLNQAQALAGIGGLQQQQVQRNLDVAKQQFDNQFNYPLQQLAIRQSALPQPDAFGKTETKPLFENTAANVLGAVATGAGALKNLGITGGDILGAGTALFNSLPSFNFPSFNFLNPFSSSGSSSPQLLNSTFGGDGYSDLF